MQAALQKFCILLEKGDIVEANVQLSIYPYIHASPHLSICGPRLIVTDDNRLMHSQTAYFYHRRTNKLFKRIQYCTICLCVVPCVHIFPLCTIQTSWVPVEARHLLIFHRHTSLWLAGSGSDWSRLCLLITSPKHRFSRPLCTLSFCVYIYIKGRCTWRCARGRGHVGVLFKPCLESCLLN